METKTKFNQISSEELQQWMDGKRSFVLIDTLTNDHFRKAHLPDAKNACVFEVTFLDQMREITSDETTEIVLYGSSARSMDTLMAAEKLNRVGYGQIHILKGGIDAWRSVGLPLEGEAPDKPDDPETRLILADGTYTVDTEQSLVEWAGRNPNTKHFETIGISKGEILVKERVISGSFEMDMNSLIDINLEGDESQPVLISHLKSDDFFFVDYFPTAKFTINSAEPVKEPFLTSPNYEIKGAMEVRGIKADQHFMATVTKTPENELLAEAHFDIDRTRWNIIYGSTRFFEHLGMHIVFDLISIQVKIVAHPTT